MNDNINMYYMWYEKWYTIFVIELFIFVKICMKRLILQEYIMTAILSVI